MKQRIYATAQLFTVILLGSYANVLAKLALSDVPAFTFVWLQILIGGTLLTVYTFGIRGERIPAELGRRVWIYIFVIGICNFSIVRVLFMLSLERLPVTTLFYLVNFVGIVTMLMSVFILKERPSIFQLIGAVLGLVGLRVFFQQVPPPQELLGVVFVTIGIFALALTNNLTRKLSMISRHRLSNNILSTVAVWIGGIPVVLVGLAFDTPPAVSGWQNWSIIVLNAIVSIAIGLTIFNYVLRTLRSYEASILAASGIIWTALFAVPILGEYLAIHQLAGIALMIIGLLLIQVRRGMFKPKNDAIDLPSLNTKSGS